MYVSEGQPDEFWAIPQPVHEDISGQGKPRAGHLHEGAARRRLAAKHVQQPDHALAPDGGGLEGRSVAHDLDHRDTGAAGEIEDVDAVARLGEDLTLGERDFPETGGQRVGVLRPQGGK